MTSSTTKYPIHPLARAVPPMSADEFTALKADILAQGQLEPIVLLEHAILDGIHRDRACRELGLAPKTREYEGTAPAAFVIAMNVRRRHLSVGQQAATAEAMVLHYRTRFPKNSGADVAKVAADLGLGEVPQHCGTSDEARNESPVIALVAKAVGVESRAIETFSTLRKQAPDLAKEVAAGTKSLYGADAERKHQAKTAAPSRGAATSQSEGYVVARDDLFAAIRAVGTKVNAIIAKHTRDSRGDAAFLAGMLDKHERVGTTFRRYVESLS